MPNSNQLPLVQNRNVSETVRNLEDLARVVDGLTLGDVAPVTTAENDFQVGGVGATIGTWVKKTLAEVVTILRTSLDSIYVPMARTITTTTPITIAGTTSADLSANRTIAIPAATAAVDGYATSVQITKLDGIAAGSQVNVLEGVTGTAPIVAGAIVGKSQAISISAATTGAAGSMSAADKTKLDGIASGSQSPWVTVKKPADESIQSDTTLSGDTDLTFLATANKTYAIRGRIWFSTPAAADFKFRFSFAGTSIFIHEVSIPCGSATETVGIETASPTTTISCLGAGTTGGYLEFDGVLVTDNTPRSLFFSWAQVTSTGSNTTVKAGSYLEYLQVD